VWRPHFNPFTNTSNTKRKYSGNIRKYGMNEVSEFLYNLQNAYNYKNNIEKVLSNKIKRYPIYKTEMFNNKIYTSFKYTNLEGFKTHFNINKTNRIVGYTPDYIGSSPSKIIKNDNLFTKVFLRYKSIIKDNTSSSFYNDIMKSGKDTRIVYSSGYTTCNSHLKEFFKDDESKLKASDIITFLRFTKNKLIYSPKISFYDNKELDFNIRINLEANPGHYTSKLISNKKRNTTEVSRTVAKRFYNNIRNHAPMKNFYLWSILGREKDIKLEDCNEPKNVGTRAIMATEDPMSTLLMWFAQKIQLSLNNENNKTFNVSGEYNIEKCNKLFSYKKDFDYYIEADWTFFDSNADGEFIKAAGCVLLDSLPNDKLHTRIKYTIIKSILTKYVALPPGVVVELNRGVPSGHPFTTLINCTLNTIYWSLIGYEIYGDNYQDFMKIEVYGDDALVFFKNNKKLSQIDEIIKKIGLRAEPLKNEFRLCNFDYKKDELPDFLKRRYYENNLIWNHKKLFDKLFYQSRKRSISEQVELLLSYINTAPKDDDLLEFCKITYKYLKEEYNKDIFITNESFKQLEKLVHQGSVDKRIIERFQLSKINVLNFDLDNKFKNILSISGIYLNYTKNDYLVTLLKNNQVEILYNLAYPPDFTVRNKFILDYDILERDIKEYHLNYEGNRKIFINEINTKISNIIYKKG